MAECPIDQNWKSAVRRGASKPTDDRADRRKSRLAEESPVQVSGLLTFIPSAAVFFSTSEFLDFSRCRQSPIKNCKKFPKLLKLQLCYRFMYDGLYARVFSAS